MKLGDRVKETDTGKCGTVVLVWSNGNVVSVQFEDITAMIASKAVELISSQPILYREEKVYVLNLHHEGSITPQGVFGELEQAMGRAPVHPSKWRKNKDAAIWWTEGHFKRTDIYIHEEIIMKQIEQEQD